ncbi:MAG: PKD domain-containing protein [candidate division Zixibacteria bacterium]|nr:PKD domain-containing protein [candidate division Zixibacteria bacterium]
MKSIFKTVLALGILLVMGASSGFCQAPRVNVMPGNQGSIVYPYAWLGRVLTIWGNVHDGTAPYTYSWDFGDGSAPVSGNVANPKYISVTHSYATMGPKRAVLTVTDANNESDLDTVVIEVVVREHKVEVNAAIEDALRWLYLQQTPTGYWYSYGGYYATSTATAILAFENNNHLPINDYNKDIYAEYVKAGLDYLFRTLISTSVPIQGAGDPEADAPGNTDHNGIGIGVNTDRSCYETGIALMAVVGSGPIASGAPNLTAPANCASNVANRTYRDIAIDMVDWLAWAQNDPATGSYRGGWRYYANYGNSDNSASQWPSIGLEAAESNWGIAAPSFVKSELLLWLAYSQASGGGNDGAFYYQPYGWPYPWSSIGPTGSGICQLSYAKVPKTDARVTRALNFLYRNWNTSGNIDNLYNYYAVAKGCLIAVNGSGTTEKINSINGIDWYDYYSRSLVNTQQADGGWPNFNNPVQYGRELNTGWSVLVLSRSIIEPGPVAVITAQPSVPPGTPFGMDGALSYHRNPAKRIMEWLWKFDVADPDAIDWSTPDASGVSAMNPGYILPLGVDCDTFNVALRVADNSDSTMTDVALKQIIVSNNENHPPTAVAGGPYAGKIGEPITFSGLQSYDLDAGDSIVGYSWDLDGDGVFGDCTDAICQRTWNAEYSGYVRLIVTDSYGASSWDSSTVKVWTSRVDIGLTFHDISWDNPYPLPGDNIVVTAVIHCDTYSDPVNNVLVRFFDGDPSNPSNQIGSDQTILSMSADDAVPLSVNYIVGDPLPRSIFVVVDPNAAIEEFNEDNNIAMKRIELPPSVGSAYGLVTANSQGLAGVTVNLFQEELLVKHAITNAAGGYLLDSLGDGDYRVEVEPPLGFTPLSDPSAQVSIAGLPVEVNFELTNAATGKIHDIWWWKTQLQYIRDKKPSVISMANINAFCQTIYKHFYLRDDGYAIHIENVTFAPGPEALDFYDVLNFMVTLAADNSYQACAARGLLTNLLNIAAGYQSQLALVSDDGATASQAITYFAGLYNLGGNVAYYSVHINTRRMHMGQMIPAGIIPLMTPNIMFKQEQKVVIPSDYSLSQNYPNPFNPVTTIELALPTASDWTIAIFNVSGQKVAEYSGHNEAGIVTVNWDASNLASGLYFYKANAGNFSATKKMVLLK